MFHFSSWKFITKHTPFLSKMCSKITQKSVLTSLWSLQAQLIFLLHMLFFLALASQNYGRQAKGIKIFLKLHENFFFVVWERTHEIFDLAAGLKDGSRPSALVFQGGRIYNSWISASMLTNQDRSLVMSHAVHRQTPTAIVKPASVKCVHSFTLLSTTQQPVLVDHFEL